jgi:hypothetical protein
MFSLYGTPKADFQTAQEQSQQLSQHLEAFHFKEDCCK